MAAAQLKKIVKKLPQTPGIYQFTDKNGQIIYVGKAKSLRKRVASYFAGKNLGPKTNLLVTKITNIKIIKVFSEFEATLLEAQLIRDHQPFFNQQSKDDKSPIYIKITNDKIPLVQTTRLQKPQKGIFLKGPFPSSKTTRDILKITRRIFPYCHHKNPRKPCLFVHLGLCPYPYKLPRPIRSESHGRRPERPRYSSPSLHERADISWCRKYVFALSHSSKD